MSRFRSDDAPTLIRAARADVDLMQVELARRADLRQPGLARMESDAKPVSEQMLERVLCAAGYRPSVPFSAHAGEIIERARAHGLEASRVSRLVMRDGNGFDSDIDLVIIPSAGTGLFDLALFVHEVEELTGFPTNVVSDTNVPAALTDAVHEVVSL